MTLVNRLSIVPAVALFAAGMLVAQTGQTPVPQEKTQETTKKTTAKTTRSKDVTVIGKVKSYTAGDKLEVETPKGSSRTFDLNAKNTNVSGAENLTVGETVKVKQHKEGDQTTITVEPYAGKMKSKSHTSAKATEPNK